MTDDKNRNLARAARSVQNLQLMLLAGMILGAIAGFLIGVYVVMPSLGSGLAGFVGVFVALVVGGFIGQRLVLNWAGR